MSGQESVGNLGQEKAIWKKLRKKLGGKRLLFGQKLTTAEDLFAACVNDPIIAARGCPKHACITRPS